MHADAESYFVPQNFSPSIWNMTECLKWEPILSYPTLNGVKDTDFGYKV